jgi:hypothetical protein
MRNVDRLVETGGTLLSDTQKIFLSIEEYFPN